MKIVLGADHGGFELKEEIKKWLSRGDTRDLGVPRLAGKYEVHDIGAQKLEPEDDFVDYAVLVAEEIAENGEARGILFCRNGYGMMIAANRFPGVRCGEAFDIEAVARGRTDDDINCLSVPADYIKNDNVRKMIEVFLETKFSGEEKYKRRLGKLESLGGGCCGGGCGK